MTASEIIGSIYENEVNKITVVQRFGLKDEIPKKLLRVNFQTAVSKLSASKNAKKLKFTENWKTVYVNAALAKEQR